MNSLFVFNIIIPVLLSSWKNMSDCDMVAMKYTTANEFAVFHKKLF